MVFPSYGYLSRSLVSFSIPTMIRLQVEYNIYSSPKNSLLYIMQFAILLNRHLRFSFGHFTNILFKCFHNLLWRWKEFICYFFLTVVNEAKSGFLGKCDINCIQRNEETPLQNVLKHCHGKTRSVFSKE